MCVGKVWPLLIGNDLNITSELLEQLNVEVIQVYGVNFSADKKEACSESTVSLTCASTTTASSASQAIATKDFRISTSSDSNKTSNAIIHATKSSSPLRSGRIESEVTLVDKCTIGNDDHIYHNIRNKVDDNDDVSIDNDTVDRYYSMNSSQEHHMNDSNKTSNNNIDDSNDDDDDDNYVDVTDEPWFENERDETLGPDDFDYIQRQLFQYPKEVRS